LDQLTKKWIDVVIFSFVLISVKIWMAPDQLKRCLTYQYKIFNPPTIKEKKN